MKKKLTVILSVLAAVLAVCILIALLMNSCQPNVPDGTDASQTGGTTEQTQPSIGEDSPGSVEVDLPNDEDGEDGDDDAGYPYVDGDVQGSGDNAVTPTSKPTQPQDPEATGDGEDDDPYAPEDSGSGEDGEDDSSASSGNSGTQSGGNTGSQDGENGTQGGSNTGSEGGNSGSQGDSASEDSGYVEAGEPTADISVDFDDLFGND